jgi:hypothetical protein
MIGAQQLEVLDPQVRQALHALMACWQARIARERRYRANGISPILVV